MTLVDPDSKFIPSGVVDHHISLSIPWSDVSKVEIPIGTAGMIVGLAFTIGYIIYFKFVFPQQNSPEHWLLGISPKASERLAWR